LGQRLTPNQIYDVHAHCVPPSFRDWLQRSGSGHGVELLDTPKGTCVSFNERFVSAPMRDSLGDLSRRIQSMDRMGVDVQLLSGWIDLTGYDLASPDGVSYTRAQNDCLAEEAAREATRLRPVATLPLQDPAEAAKELERAMGELGMVGAQLATTVGPDWIDRAGLDDVWEAADALGAFIILHPMAPLTGVTLDRYFMDNSVGRPAETTIALAGLMYSGVFDRYPNLQICGVHGGGFVPFQIGRLDRAYEMKPDLAARQAERLPSEYLRRIYVDTVVHSPDVLRFLVDTMGADRLLVGTDYPFEMGDDDPVALVDSMPGIAPAERESILSGNARRLFG
jgi:aminocarboxymuconate-semialdehyde decarboxylase